MGLIHRPEASGTAPRRTAYRQEAGQGWLDLSRLCPAFHISCESGCCSRAFPHPQTRSLPGSDCHLFSPKVLHPDQSPSRPAAEGSAVPLLRRLSLGQGESLHPQMPRKLSPPPPEETHSRRWTDSKNSQKPSPSCKEGHVGRATRMPELLFRILWIERARTSCTSSQDMPLLASQVGRCVPRRKQEPGLVLALAVPSAMTYGVHCTFLGFFPL